MHHSNRLRGILFAYSSLLAIAAILILSGMLSSPSEPGSAVLLGLSLPRLVVALGLLTAFVFFGFISIKALRDGAWAEETLEHWFGRSPLRVITAWLGSISLGLGWISCFLPAYRAGILATHWERIRPPMSFLLLAGLATLAVILLTRSNFTLQDLRLSKTYKRSLLLFLPSIALVGIMLATDFGVYAPEDYWYGAGVPILFSQLLTALLAGLLFSQFEQKWASARFDLAIFLLIFVVTAVLWAREPLQKSFLFIGPYAPNRVLYPFADAAIFDTASQFALIGQKFFIFGGQFFERALYISFLVYLHSLFGQDYGQLMAAQAAIYAVFPALVYLVGKSMHSRAMGFAAAVVAAFRGANAIAASNMIDMANPKMMLTDFPTAIGIALIVLFTCELLKQPQQKWHYVLWLGGFIGLTVMLRTNTLLLLPLIPVFIFFRFAPRWKPWLVSSFLLVVAIFAVTLPWELRNQSLGGQMYASIVAKFQNVLQRRYAPPVEPNTGIPDYQALSFLSLRSTLSLGVLTTDADMLQEPPCQTTACFVPNHFLHNVLTSVLVLPTSAVLDDLRHTVRESHPYWQPDWDGSFTPTSLFLFGLNLFLIVLGIYVAWERHGLAGLAPLAIFMFYNLSNAFARTSGGRYIVPIDWIVTVYFLIGIFYTIQLAASGLGIRWTLPTPDGQNSWAPTAPRPALSRTFLILAILFGLGALIPFAETLHPHRYQNVDVSKLLSDHETEIAAAGFSLEEINSFLQNPNAAISVGRALYPRYYIENEGEVHFYPMVVMGFPRTTFTLIGPAGEEGIVLPGEKPGYFPHAVDTMVLGCREQFYVDALAVVVLDEEGAVYTRSPESSLQCPLKQPVCDNNHNCY